jgi:hypothetical protein
MMAPKTLPVDTAAIETAVTQTKSVPNTTVPRTVGDTAETEFVPIGDLIPQKAAL